MISMPEYTYQNCVGVQKVKRQEKNTHTHTHNHPPPQCLFEASYSAMENQELRGDMEREGECVWREWRGLAGKEAEEV